MIVLFAVAAFALYLRVNGLAHESPWGDEVASLAHIEASNASAYLDCLSKYNPEMTPVYFVLQYYWWHATGHSVYNMRLLGVGFGVAAVVMTYLLGVRCFGQMAGLVAALAAAGSFPLALAAQEIRMYALFYLLALLSVYSLVRGVAEGKRTWWFVHGVVNLALIWTHLMGALLPVAEWVFLLVIWRRSLGRLLLWSGVHAAFAVPLVLWVLGRQERLARASQWIPVSSLRQVVKSICHTGIQSSDPWSFVGGLAALIFLGALVSVGSRVARQGAATSEGEACGVSPNRWVLLLVLVWLVPHACLYGVSLLWKTCYAERYVLGSSYALFLLVGAGVAWIPLRVPRAGVALVLAGLYLWQSMSLPHPWRTDWYSIRDCIRSNAASSDRVMVQGIYSTRVLRFLWPEKGEAIENVPLDVAPSDAIASGLRQAEVVWFVRVGWGGLQPFEDELHREGYTWDSRRVERGMPNDMYVAAYRFVRKAMVGI